MELISYNIRNNVTRGKKFWQSCYNKESQNQSRWFLFSFFLKHQSRGKKRQVLKNLFFNHILIRFNDGEIDPKFNDQLQLN